MEPLSVRLRHRRRPAIDPSEEPLILIGLRRLPAVATHGLLCRVPLPCTLLLAAGGAHLLFWHVRPGRRGGHKHPPLPLRSCARAGRGQLRCPRCTSWGEARLQIRNCPLCPPWTYGGQCKGPTPRRHQGRSRSGCRHTKCLSEWTGIEEIGVEGEEESARERSELS
jgi:hypothetical protein